jgi:hypothetical protein
MPLDQRPFRSTRREARNWFDGHNGPSGENLVSLVRHSDAVLETVLGLSGRQYLLPVAGILGLRDQLDALVHAIDDLRVH